MADVESTHPCYVPYFALALYGAVRAGIREGECARLDQALRNGESPVMGGGIKIQGKTGAERILCWNAPLRAWLEAYPLSNCLLPDGEHAADAVIRSVRKKHQLPHNVLRHTGISAMALTTDSIVGTGITCDTSETMIRRHYLGQMTKDEAMQIYAIRPSLKR
jgi:hypothetical protein